MKTHSPREGNGFNHRVSLRKHVPTEYSELTIQSIKVIHEFDDYGNHRICVKGRAPCEWASYRSIAKLYFPSSGGTIAATTDYYNGELPALFMYFT